MLNKNRFYTIISVAIVLSLVSSCMIIPAGAAAVSWNLLSNREFRDDSAGWVLGKYGTVDDKVTQEGYQSVKLSVAKAKSPLDAKVWQALSAGSWAVGDTLTFSAYLARGKTSVFTKKTLPVLALYAVVGEETMLFPSGGVKKLKDIKEAGTKNKSSAWSQFSATMTVP